MILEFLEFLESDQGMHGDMPCTLPRQTPESTAPPWTVYGLKKS